MGNPLTKNPDMGHEWVRSLYHLIHTARVYEDNNQLTRKSVSIFQERLSGMVGDTEVTLRIWRGRFHIDGEKLPYRREFTPILNTLNDYFSRRHIGGITFFATSREAKADDILAMARLFNNAVQESDLPEALSIMLREKGYGWLRIIPRQPDDDSGQIEKSVEVMRRETAQNVYLHAVEAVREVAGKASKGIVGVRKARRLAQTVVDLINEDVSLMLGLTTIKDYDDYTYTHSVNVSLLATCLGKHIGMPDLLLEHLSVCGLFHDLGKVGVSKDILLKTGALTDAEWNEMKTHPIIGVSQILKLNAPASLRSRIIIGPFEHHLNPDLSGYPRTVFIKRVSLLGKILRIADVYEALTAQRAYRPEPYTPDESLRKMWQEGEKSFDLILLKSFIQMMGVYPIGSVVRLNDGNLALVMDYPDDTEKDRPLLLQLHKTSRGDYVRGDLIFLPRIFQQADTRQLQIVESVHPSNLGVQVAEFFLQGE